MNKINQIFKRNENVLNSETFLSHKGSDCGIANVNIGTSGAEIGGAFTNFEEAKRLIDSGLEIGVDAIKFQTLEADTITIKDN